MGKLSAVSQLIKQDFDVMLPGQFMTYTGDLLREGFETIEAAREYAESIGGIWGVGDIRGYYTIKKPPPPTTAKHDENLTTTIRGRI